MQEASGSGTAPDSPPLTGWRGRLTDHGHLMRGSAWLTATVAANAVSGFAFWLLAARVYPEDPIGEAAALFTAVVFVNYAANLGLPIAVGRYAKDRSDSSAVLFGWALVVTTGMSAVGAGLFWLIAGRDIVEPLRPLGPVLGPLLFFAVVTGMSIALLVEIRLTALRRWGWVLARVAVVGVIRLPVIGWNPIDDSALWLFLLVAVLPAASSLALAGGLAVRGRARLGALPAETRSAARFAMVNYASLLALRAPQFILPLVVALQVSADSYAAFYIAFQIATVAFLVPHMLGQVLLVEGGRGSTDLQAQSRVALEVTAGIMTAVALGGLVLARIVPIVYGATYDDAGQILPLFLWAGIAWAVTSIFITRARVVEAERAIIGIAFCLAIAILVPAVILTARSGIDGAAMAWLGGHVLTAVVAVLVGRHLPDSPPAHVTGTTISPSPSATL